MGYNWRMDKNWDHLKHEQEIYKHWEENNVFKPKDSGERPFCIIMPPPNANGELHLGHATFVAVSDTLIRYHRMNGSPTLWLPGVDHAGILTQVTFEKKLKKDQNKNRYDLGREEFVKQCYQFCLDNKYLMENQLKALGASCDWSREKFTLDPNVSALVYETFLKMYSDGLVYRGYRTVNWCPRCRSTLADVELERVVREDKLYYVKYKLVEGGEIVIATTRPETIWIDTHAAVNPKDPKKNELIGKKIINPLFGHKMEIIGDESVDIEFGTGVLKLTPAHDLNDYEVALRHSLPMKNGVDFDGKLTLDAGRWAGMKTMVAREEIEKYLSENGILEKVVPYSHEVAICERCGTVIEPLLSRQWFIKTKSLAEPAIKAVEEKRVKITPEKYETMYFNWMKNIRDWPISRQIWWGHRLPVWYRKEDQITQEQQVEFTNLKSQDPRARTDLLEAPVISINKPETTGEWVQDPDTFDTWFSSGQWPFTTLKAGKPSDFEKFYPTSVMNTAYEILFLWVARMIMFGIYLTGKVPFETALINGVLRDEKGMKMSKSKGNGVNVSEAVTKYGADAVRMALLSGRDIGNDMLISKQQMEEKIKGYRNFANKVWNIARFVDSKRTDSASPQASLGTSDKWILEELDKLNKSVTDNIDKFRLGQAAEEVYEFVWHKFADVYIEKYKLRDEKNGVLEQVFCQCLKLLQPFMPFVTEVIWSEMKKPGMLATASWN